MPGSSNPAGAAPIPVILDTDMWGDIDDVMALAMLHALQDRGEVEIRAIACSMTASSCVNFVRLINAYYGHPDIPIGLVTEGVRPPSRWRGDGGFMDPNAPMYTEYIPQLRRADGEAVYARYRLPEAQPPDGVTVLRDTLSSSDDQSVTVIAIGFSTNLARLLGSEGDDNSPLSGRDLVKRKVKSLSIMACSFGDGNKASALREYNIRHDVPSAALIFSEWPTSITVSPFELGASLLIKGDILASSFKYDEENPVLTTYQYMDETNRTKTTRSGSLHDHKSFDLTSVLQAVRPSFGYFTVSQPGTISISSEGYSSFESQPEENVGLLGVEDEQRERVLEAMMMLMTQPPRAFVHDT